MNHNDLHQRMESLAILSSHTTDDSFVYGDNLDGYYWGNSSTYGMGRYRIKSDEIVFDFASYIGGTLQDREASSTQTQLYPHGVRTEYPNDVWEEFILHRYKRAISLHLHSPNREELALVLQVSVFPHVISQEKHLILLSGDITESSSTLPKFLAIVSEHPLSIVPVSAGWKLSTPNDITDLTIHLAFGFTQEEAQTLARLLLTQDPIADHKHTLYNFLSKTELWTSDPEYNRALLWSKLAASFFVTTEMGKGIWAGLPWFKDHWGRDTFIAFSGTLLVSGQFEEAWDVLQTFAQRQLTDPHHPDFGRIPNRVTDTETIYNTTDGTPWLIRAMYDYLRYTGETERIPQMYPVVYRFIEGALANYVDEEGFLTHADADTWMDAKIEGKWPWSPRGNRAVEVQVLWYTTLKIGIWMAHYRSDSKPAETWKAVAHQLKIHFIQRFWNPATKTIADRITGDGLPDETIRPNQLMLITIPFGDPVLLSPTNTCPSNSSSPSNGCWLNSSTLDDRLVTTSVEAMILKNAVSTLLFPYGIVSLDPNHSDFHPFHDNRPEHHKDAAYHNGTIWGWNAGFTVSALIKFGQTELAYALTQNLADQILYQGTRGTMSELVDALPDKQGRLTLSGTFSQAWSVSEYARNGFQDYAGFQPNLLGKALVFRPAIPRAWEHFEGRFRFGTSGTVALHFERNGQTQIFQVNFTGYSETLAIHMILPSLKESKEGAKRVWLRICFCLDPEQKETVYFDTISSSLKVQGKETEVEIYQELDDDWIGSLQFCEPPVGKTFLMLQGQDVLKHKVQKKYKV